MEQTVGFYENILIGLMIIAPFLQYL